MVKFQCDGNNEVAVFFGSIKNAVTVGKAEVGFGESLESACGGVVDFGFDESVGEFLAVGTDVLDGGGAGEAWDTAQGFNTGEASFASVGHYIVPVFAPHNFKTSRVTRRCYDFDAAHAVDDDDAVEAFIVAKRVGTVTEDESREIELAGETVGVGNVLLCLYFENIAGGAAKTHGG